MIIRSPLRSPLSAAIQNAFNRVSSLAPTPPASIYGAAADAGQINETDPLTGGGNRYWVNSSTGSNVNTGLVQALPFQYLDKLNDYTGQGGSFTAPQFSQFVLARGTTYDGYLTANQFSGGFFGNYLFGASGSGARPKVLFKNSTALHSTTNGGIYLNKADTKVRNLSIDMRMSMAATATVVTGTFVDGDVCTATGGTASGAVGTFTYDAAGQYNFLITSFPTVFANGDVITAPGGKQATLNSVSYNTGVTTLDSGHEIRNTDVSNCLGNGILLSSVARADNLVIDNCTISNACRKQTTGAGIDGGFASNVTITQNTVVNCGRTGSSLNHNIYLNDITGALVARNRSYMTASYGSWGLVVHGLCAGFTIEDNLLENCNNGMALAPGAYGRMEYYDSFIVQLNIVRNNGYTAGVGGLGQGYISILTAVTNSAFKNNLYYGNAFGISMTVGGGVNAAVTNAVTFSHETFYNNTSTSTAAQFIITGACTAITIQNSIFMSTAASGYLFKFDAAATPGVTMRNCVLYMPNNSGNAIQWNGTDYTVAAWMTAFGNALGCINADPLFSNAAGNDFTLQAGSPAKLAGYNSGITTDFAGNARHATTPSIGAYE